MKIKTYLIGGALVLAGVIAGYVGAVAYTASNPDNGAAAAAAYICQKARQRNKPMARLRPESGKLPRGVLSWELVAACEPPGSTV